MDSLTFDRMTRVVSTAASRRQTFRALALGALGLASTRLPADTSARERKNAKKKPNFNQFGCLDVGAKCRGKDGLCCSGICGGKKPKQGEKDNRRCVAHDTGGCQAGDGACGMVGGKTCISSANRDGECQTTTGNAGYCAAGSGSCQICKKDRDCQITSNNPTAACIPCSSCAEGTACVFA